MGPAFVDRIDDRVDLISRHLGAGYVIGSDPVAFDHCLADQKAIFHRDVFYPHQIGPGSIDNNTAEARGS